MFAGHVGAGLAIASAERRLNAGVYVLAACWLDFVLWALVALGIESATIPADYASRHFVLFDFPYSHGLLASLGWSALAALVAALVVPAGQRVRVALLVAVAVWSHWGLDALVHVAELPVAGPDSTRVGLGLWRHMPVALGLESLLLISGTALFVTRSRLGRGKAIGIAAVAGVTLLMTAAGMTLAPPPPSIPAMAASSLLTLAIVCALVFWFARPASRASVSAAT
jgi:membrane-bound metal-dependent hydrolase YbcI (DUF457 family)